MAPTVSIDPQPGASHQLSIGQVVKAQVLERLSAEKSLISISGVHMQARTEIAVAPGDVLYFTVSSNDPLVLQLHGMEYRAINPFSTVESVVRLLGLSADTLTIVVLSHMMSRNQKISKADVEQTRRAISALREEGISQETDEELLEIIDDLRAKHLPLSAAHVMLARKRVASDDLGALASELLSLLGADEIPAELREPVLRYFKKTKSTIAALRSAIESLGLDYEHSLVAWGVGSADAAKTGSLKASLMALIKYCSEADRAETHAALCACATRMIDAIESQQLDALTPSETDEFSMQLPIMLEGTLHTLSLSVMQHGSQGMFQDLPREYSFRMSIELSELGMVTASGRLAGRQISAALSVERNDDAARLEESFDRLADALRDNGCIPMSLSARVGSAAQHQSRRMVVNASA